jgi:ABC-type lipoprotein export system ATPase subunit
VEPWHDPIGSIWRVWDLHFHTPSSYDYKDMSVTNEDIVRALTDAHVSLVAVTDHHTMDVARIAELQVLGHGRLTVLPGIELRTELGGSNSVHLVAVFPEDCDCTRVWDTLRVKHGLDQRAAERGHERVYVDFSDFSRDVHELGGLTIVHAGSKANSIEEIANSSAFKQALKADLARDAIDVFEIANPSSIPDYRNIVFPAIDKQLPLVLCSDAHRLSDYSPPSCWVKADPSFYGLSQALFDPWDRVCLGETPPALVRISHNKAKYIGSISFSRTPGSDLAEAWFDGISVPLNPGLVAIVGNKGSGKSALSETIGLLGGCQHCEHFSFLHKDRFLHGRKPKAGHFNAALEWVDGSTVSHCLNASNDPLEERVRYIPQNYLETVCNDLQVGDQSEFSTQIEQVIFSHVPPAERARHQTLRSLIEYQTAEIEANISRSRERLQEANASIVGIEYQQSAEHQSKLVMGLESKRRDLEVIDAAGPQPVAKPTEDPTASPDMKAKVEELDRVDAEISELEAALQKNADLQRIAKQGQISCSKLLQAVDNFSDRYSDLQGLWETEGASAGVPIGEVVTLEIRRQRLEQALLGWNARLDETATAANGNLEGSLARRLASGYLRRTELRSALSAPQQAYEQYLEDEKQWINARNAIIGDAETADTVTWYEAQLASLSGLPDEHSEAVRERDELTAAIFEGLKKWRLVYEEAYKPVQDYIDGHPVLSGRARFEFSASIAERGLDQRFFGLISQGRKGSFCRDGGTVLKKLVDSADFGSITGVKQFTDDVLDHLSYDRRTGEGSEVAIESQLKDGASKQEIYDLLFSLSYLRPAYSLRWAGKDIELLSPGEKGALLLVFYLLIDKDTCPLLIDQPEENLDNRTVFDILVPCVNEARRRRQILLVTHNPNLAVVCDADQVITASLDAENQNQLSYQSGAIENPEIGAAVVDVLEGTKPAFEKREHKYVASMPDWLV